MPMPPILVRREQEKAMSPFAPTPEFEARVRVEFGEVELIFSTGDKNVSRFTVPINPHHFGVLARAMMHANSTEAIKAFGAALAAGIPEPREVWFPGIDDVDPASLTPAA